jgi:hypothetical protein
VSISIAQTILFFVAKVAVAVRARIGIFFSSERISFILENHLRKACSPFLTAYPLQKNQINN